MRRITVLGVLTTFAVCGLTAQTSPAPGGKYTVPAPTNQDLNIRAYIELLRTDVSKSKAQIMGQVMQLDADQSAKFWPIYKDYQADEAKIGDSLVRMVKDYAANYDNMTDELADNLANRLLALELERTALKKQYYGRVKGAIGAIHATRFLQVENQLERLVDLQVASELPVIQ